MSEFKETFNSSLGKKLIMALTGLFLCTFLIVHLGGNLLLLKNDDGYAFNMYGNFLTHFPPIEVVAYILYLCILVHTIYAIILTTKNRKARPIGYAVTASDNATWQSKNMGLLGTVLFLFLVIHMSDFWYRYKYSDTVQFKEYRTDLSSGKTTSVEFAPASPDFENSVSTQNDVEIVRVKEQQTQKTISFSQWWY